MKIVEIEVIPLTGATVDGGWPQGHEPQENLHTLVQIRTDRVIGRVMMAVAWIAIATVLASIAIGLVRSIGGR